jgi:hypothetical protein
MKFAFIPWWKQEPENKKEFWLINIQDLNMWGLCTGRQICKYYNYNNGKLTKYYNYNNGKLTKYYNYNNGKLTWFIMNGTSTIWA